MLFHSRRYLPIRNLSRLLVVLPPQKKKKRKKEKKNNIADLQVARTAARRRGARGYNTRNANMSYERYKLQPRTGTLVKHRRQSDPREPTRL